MRTISKRPGRVTRAMALLALVTVAPLVGPSAQAGAAGADRTAGTDRTAGAAGAVHREATATLAVPTGTLTSMTGAAGQGRVRGTVDLPGHVGVLAVRAVVGGLPHDVTHSVSGTGPRAFDTPFTISVTANPPICVHAFDGAAWQQIGTCLHTAVGWSNSMTGGPAPSGRLLGVAKVPGWSGTLAVRAVVNGVPQPSVLTTGGGTDYQPFSAPFTLTGALSSRSVCLQGNSYGYWHPMGPCRWTATGTFAGMSGTSGSGTAAGVVTMTNWWDYPIQVRVTVDGVIDPESYRYSAGGTGNRAYSAPFRASATASHTVCVQANSHGYWNQLGCRTRPAA
ncbi:MAG TPA: hypothetical protein VGD67_04795 [Pseudonocardiaceae bacterium]